jgi:hypothetical protein
LLVNAYSSGQSLITRENEYNNWLNQCGINSFDITRVNEVSNNNYTELAPDNYTQSRIFELFDVIIWFGKNISYSMSLAQRTTDGFFALGGKMFMAVEISSDIDPQTGYLGFTPIDSLISLPPGVNGFRINKGSGINPVSSGWPVLKSDTNSILPSARPFYENIHSLPLYDAEIIKSTSLGQAPWTGKSTIIAKKTDLGQTIFVISSIEMHYLNGNNNIDQLFYKIFKEEFGIQ